MNYDLPDAQAIFRKVRGTRDQIANICWIIKKARETQKNIKFCFVDYAKAFDCVKWRSKVAQLCPTLCNPMDCSLPGSSHGIFQARMNTAVGCYYLLQRIFPTQGSNPGLPHCRQMLYHLSHQGSLWLQFLTMWTTTNCGKFLKRREYQKTWPASWETWMQVRKRQLQLEMEQQTGSK